MIIASVENTVGTDAMDHCRRFIQVPVEGEESNWRLHAFDGFAEARTMLFQMIVSMHDALAKSITPEKLHSLVRDHYVMSLELLLDLRQKRTGWLLPGYVIALDMPKLEKSA